MLLNKAKEILISSRNWDDFNKKIKLLSNKEKGDCFEWLIKFYLTLHPKYRTKLKNVWLLNFEHVPAEVRTHLNLPNSDEGIDLIAETKEGLFWAIQSKYRKNETHSLNRQELSTFTDLSFNICRNISHALICTNTSKISHKFSLYEDNISFCTSDVWSTLEPDFFENIRDFFQGKKATSPKLTPRKHQHAALIAAASYFQKNGRGKLIHPCSAGKTLTAYWIARELNARSILIAVPSLSLINQTLEEWAKRFIADNIDVSWICVCSDKTVNAVSLDHSEITPQDLGIEVVTDPKAIANWLRHDKSEFKVVFSTYQSGLALSDAVQSCAFTFDLAIMDEAHKTVGQKGSLFTHLLSDDNIKINKRLFMTATERRFRGDSDRILSMDQENVYGKTIHLYTFKEAIEDGVLCDYKIATIYVTEQEVKTLIEQNFYVKPIGKHWKKEVESQLLASAIALRKAYIKYGFTHALSYHSSLVRAKTFQETQMLYAKTLFNNDALQFFHIEGSTPAGLRKSIFRDFINAPTGLITNVRCLTEGVNLPRIDSILFADPKKSKIDIAQAVGRALRPHSVKKMSYIIVPVLIDEISDSLESIKNKTYAALLQLIRSLATQDERIIEYFRALPNKPKRGFLRDYSPFEVDIPIGKDIDLAYLNKSIELCFVDKIAPLSWRSLEEAKRFVHTLGLQSYKEWRRYCKGILTDKPLKPNNIPAKPDDTYKKNGWISWADFLGTENISNKKKIFLSYEEARSIVQKLKLRNQDDWKEYCKGTNLQFGLKLNNIPNAPDQFYEEWTSWGDWLGTGYIACSRRQYRSFEEARSFVQSLGLKSQNEWRRYTKGLLEGLPRFPADIPANPNQTYKQKGWKGFGDWFGTGIIAPRLRKYRTFQEARDFVRQLGLKNQKEWLLYAKNLLPGYPPKPSDIPAHPRLTYKNQGWKSDGDWIGSGFISYNKRDYLPFDEARTFVHKLQLKNSTEWYAYCNHKFPEKPPKPSTISKRPEITYRKKGWVGWGDWLGISYIPTRRDYRSFEEAKLFVQSLKITTLAQWKHYCQTGLPGRPKLPPDIPLKPERTYKANGWAGYPDWLGNSRRASPAFNAYLTFDDAKAYVHTLALKNTKEWGLFCKGKLSHLGTKPQNIPTHPERAYARIGWRGYGDWLGTNNPSPHSRQFLSYEKAKKFVHSLNLKSRKEWHRYCSGELSNKPNLPKNIPRDPHSVYKNKGWLGVGNWLGTNQKATQLRPYLSFAEARSFVRKLKLKTGKQWKSYCKGDLPHKPLLQENIPKAPWIVYEDVGWISMPDWLGTIDEA